jgi:hypothetical protein
MTRLDTLKTLVSALSDLELAEFRAWLAEYDWQRWDEELERDIAAGKLDELVAEALAEAERGETKEI